MRFSGLDPIHVISTLLFVYTVVITLRLKDMSGIHSFLGHKEKAKEMIHTGTSSCTGLLTD